jgi:GTP pyrophosphokinase
MDEIAEKGLAAHWKYKGIKSENDLDAWMNNVRDILEAAESGPMELMKNLKMDVYDKEVFVFTPKGDLYKLPLGASVLDFAFNIHSRIGCQCTGARVNGKNQKINHKLSSGDTVEILTSSTQTPKQDWLNFVVTSKARSKIKQTIKEQGNKAAELGKELLTRRFKNRKIDIDEGRLMKVIKKLGFKTATDFYAQISNEQLDPANIIDGYLSLEQKAPDPVVEGQSATDYIMQPAADTADGKQSDVLVIGDDVKGLNYRMARCCNPIYGDPVFGFVSAEGVIKIHRYDCPNAANIREKYPYRIITTRWSGKIGQQFAATLRVVGHDDIGIVTNITSIINKESSTSLRSISIDSHDGLFQGFLVVGVADTVALNSLMKKIKTVKGVKDVQRSK